jgi:hypothetical protein
MKNNTKGFSLAISASTTKKENEAKLTKIIAANIHPKNILTFLITLQPMSQFQHITLLYQNLVRMDNTRDNCWVLFADGDDVWHPQRHDVYFKHITKVHDDKDTVSFTTPHFAVWVPGEQSKHEPLSIKSPDDVGRMLKSGNLMLRKSVEELWQFSVRFSILATFLTQSNQNLRYNPFCKVAFMQYIKIYTLYHKRSIQSIDCPAGDWVYFYDHDDTHVSHGLVRKLSIKQSDISHANKLILSLKAAKDQTTHQCLLHWFSKNKQQSIKLDIVLVNVFAIIRRCLHFFFGSSYGVSHSSKFPLLLTNHIAQFIDNGPMSPALLCFMMTQYIHCGLLKGDTDTFKMAFNTKQLELLLTHTLSVVSVKKQAL